MMTAIVFNGTKIHLDSDMELHVIRGDLHIDTKAFKPVPKARSVTKRVTKAKTVRTMSGTSVAGTLRNANLKVGKSMEIKANSPTTITSALAYMEMKGKVSKTGKAGVYQVTRTA